MRNSIFGIAVLSIVSESVSSMEFDFDRSTAFPKGCYLPIDQDTKDSSTIKKIEIHIPGKARTKRKSAVNELAKSTTEYVQKVSDHNQIQMTTTTCQPNAEK